MEQGSTTSDADSTGLFAGEAWFDPIEAGIRKRARGFIQELLEQELTAALGRDKSERAAGEPKGCRNGTRERQLLGSFGPVEVEVPRARMAVADGGTREWRSQALPRYARMTRQVEALIAGAYLSGTNTRRVKRALVALLGGAVGKDVVSRTWRKVRTDWDAWNKRDLAGKDVVRLIPAKPEVCAGTARSCACAWTARPPTSLCWSSWACAGTGRRCRSRSRTWAARARPPGAASLTA